MLTFRTADFDIITARAPGQCICCVLYLLGCLERRPDRAFARKCSPMQLGSQLHCSIQIRSDKFLFCYFNKIVFKSLYTAFVVAIAGSPRTAQYLISVFFKPSGQCVDFFS